VPCWAVSGCAPFAAPCSYTIPGSIPPACSGNGEEPGSLLLQEMSSAAFEAAFSVIASFRFDSSGLADSKTSEASMVPWFIEYKKRPTSLPYERRTLARSNESAEAYSHTAAKGGEKIACDASCPAVAHNEMTVPEIAAYRVLQEDSAKLHGICSAEQPGCYCGPTLDVALHHATRGLIMDGFAKASLPFVDRRVSECSTAASSFQELSAKQDDLQGSELSFCAGEYDRPYSINDTLCTVVSPCTSASSLSVRSYSDVCNCMSHEDSEGL